MTAHQFTAIYNELFLDIYRYVFFRIPHQQEAEDVVSQVFIEAYRTFPNCNEQKGSVRQWIFGIARFSVIDYWKSKKRAVHVDIDTLEQLLVHADWPEFDEACDAQLFFDHVMESVPPDIRALFALRYIDGLTYSEIAELVNKKPEAIRKLFSLTHQKLRQSLLQTFPDIEPNEIL